MNVPTILSMLLLVAGSTAFAAEPDAQDGERKPLAESASPRAATSDAAPAASQSSAPAMRRGDRLELDTTIVTGNRELPKVLYIVPWKKADIGDLPAQPFNTLLDEALTPVDRDVFRREVTYYGAMSSGADSANPASARPAVGPEK